MQYLIFTYFLVLVADTLHTFQHEFVEFRSSNTLLSVFINFTVASNAFNKRCLVKADTKKNRHIVNGNSFFDFLVIRVDMVSFSTKSHLFTRITTPFLFFSANQKYFDPDLQNHEASIN
jgi:hypothetical protein